MIDTPSGSSLARRGRMCCELHSFASPRLWPRDDNSRYVDAGGEAVERVRLRALAAS